MPGYGSRYWADRTKAGRRRNYPSCRGEHRTDIVVIGGGLTGCLMASVLAGGGFDVILVEADRLATGATERGLGTVMPQAAKSFRDAESALGRRDAKTIWRDSRRSARELATALRKLPLRSDVEPMSLTVNARTADESAWLRREHKALKDAGLHAPWLTPQAAWAELGTASTGALRFHDGAFFDPVKAAFGFAASAAASGTRIFERTPVKKTKFTRTEAEVVLAGGSIRARGVVLATGEPGSLAPQLKRHVRRSTGYAVVTAPLTAAMRREVGSRQTVVTEAAEDPHFIRWLPEDRVLVAGALSKPVGPRESDRAVVRRTAQLMYEFSVRYPVISGLPAAWGWHVPIVSALDGLPWIGPHRNYPFHFFALALGWHGEALAWFAARAALRHFKGESRKDDAALGFGRHD